MKTHADDSVLMRSPEPDGTGRRQSGVTYTTASMQPLAATAAQAAAYYAGLGNYYPQNAVPTPGGYYYPQQQPGSQEAAIAQAAQAAQAHTDSKKRSFDGVDQFFEDAKRHKIQPVYDGAMAQRLSALQFVPSTTAEMDFNGHTTTATAPAVSAATSQTYTLPSLRTKQDLIDADNFLTQLSANVYDASGGQFSFRTNAAQSPHTPTATAPQPSPQQNHNSVGPDGAATMAPVTSQGSSGTPALSPPQSNYTTSHSPHQHHTPPSVSPHTSAASMYPSLPAVVTSGDVGGAYPAPVSSAPATALGSTFDAERRRVSVGVLQKAKNVSMDYENSKPDFSNSAIDPSLSDLVAESAPEKSAVPTQSELELLSSLKGYVKRLLEEVEENEKKVAALADAKEELQIDQDQDQTMTDAPDISENKEADAQTEAQTDAQALYPILKAVEAC